MSGIGCSAPGLAMGPQPAIMFSIFALDDREFVPEQQLSAMDGIIASIIFFMSCIIVGPSEAIGRLVFGLRIHAAKCIERRQPTPVE